MSRSAPFLACPGVLVSLSGIQRIPAGAAADVCTEFGVLVQLATIQIVSSSGASFLEISGLVAATFSLTLGKEIFAD